MKVLSIDGGGMRGVYSAAYLQALEQAFSIRREVSGLDIAKAFDLIVGTSTGAILGCGLAIGRSPAEMVSLYQKHAKEIFPIKLPGGIGLDLIFQLFSRPRLLRLGDAALKKALQQTLGDVTLRGIWQNRCIALAVTAVNMSTFRGCVFKTPHNKDSDHRDDATSLVDVCLASSAAPLFRSLAAIDHISTRSCDVFADGGLWANNPVLVALVESLRMLDGRNEEITIFCLGTCGKPEGEVIRRDQVHRSLTDWKFGGEAAALSIAAQEFAFDMIADFLVPHLTNKVKIIRFPSEKIPGALLQFLDLDETRPEGLEALVRQARQDAHMTNREIGQGTVEGESIRSLFENMPARQ